MMNVLLYSPEYDEIISVSGYPGSLQSATRDGFDFEAVRVAWEYSDWVFIGFL